jgi:hypothetical protein
MKKSPRLRNVEKVRPPYPLNNFPTEFGHKVGKEIIYLLTTKGKPVLEGSEWEEIFALSVGADWKPSNVGLDDVVLDCCAWGAKTAKSNDPLQQKSIRLISGRNSPTYSFNDAEIIKADPNHLGEMILTIWNERVSAVRRLYKHVRTVVLIKSNDLSEVVIFEFDTIRYDPELFIWKWNERKNLEGFFKNNEEHKFTWQPHGSQFTIIENIPKDSLYIKIKLPKKLNKETILENLGFNEKWVVVTKKHA